MREGKRHPDEPRRPGRDRNVDRRLRDRECRWIERRIQCALCASRLSAVTFTISVALTLAVVIRVAFTGSICIAGSERVANRAAARNPRGGPRCHLSAGNRIAFCQVPCERIAFRGAVSRR